MTDRLSLSSCAAAAGLALLSFGLPAQALDLEAMTEAEREAFGAQIRLYLLENPEVLMEAIAVLEGRQAAEAAETDQQLVAQNAADLFASPLDWVGGNPEGDITVVEFIDYRCSFCRRAAPELAELLEADDNIRLVVKEFPILGEDSTLMARFVLAARLVEGDDAYEDLHHAMIALRGTPREAVLVGLADDLGYDGAAIWAEMENPEIQAVISANYDLAQRMQISGTPTFVFGDQLIRGFIEVDQMTALVEAARGEDGG